MERIAAWMVLGILAGLIARWIVPGSKEGGWFSAMILGIGGAFVGGWIARYIGFLPPAQPGDWLPSLRSIGSASTAAVILLACWRWLRP
jgi:uncharacterized membrane protein YeaQ/YmgE (transglycosylase-associated protein family)